MSYYNNLINSRINKEKNLYSALLQDLQKSEINVIINNPFFKIVNNRIVVKTDTTGDSDFSDLPSINNETAKQLLKSIRLFVLYTNIYELESFEHIKYQLDNSISTIDFLFLNKTNKIETKPQRIINQDFNKRIINKILAILQFMSKDTKNIKYLEILYYSFFDISKTWSINEISKKMFYGKSQISKIKEQAIKKFCESYNLLRSRNYDTHEENCFSE